MGRGSTTNTQNFPFLLVSFLAVLLIVVLALPDPGKPLDAEFYLPLHAALEVASVCVAAMIFGIGICIQPQRRSEGARWLAYMFLGVALLDFSHTLSYDGMIDFVTPSGDEKAINFWLAARTFAAVALVGAALIPFQGAWSKSFVLPAAILTVVALLHVVFLFFPHWVPRTFLADKGLTPFKIWFEYILIAAYLIAATLFFRSFRSGQDQNSFWLMESALIIAMSEFLFTRYADTTDTYNLLGHVYKVIAYSFLFRGIFVAMVQAPYLELAQSEAKLKATLQALPDMLFELDHNGKILQVHTQSDDEQMLSSEAVSGRNLHEVLPIDTADRILHVMSQTAADGIARSIQITLEMPEGQREFDCSIACNGSRKGEAPTLLMLSRDITERRTREAQLHKLSRILEKIPSPIVVTDANMQIEYVNKAFTKASGYTAKEALGRHPGFFKSGQTPAKAYRDMWVTLKEGKTWKGELVNRRKDGSLYTELAQIYPIRNENGEISNYLAHKEDITEKKALAAKVVEASQYDPLTGLPNRASFVERFRKAANWADRHDMTMGLMYIDLDKFKVVNDALGHEAGDMLLREIGNRMQGLTGEHDMVSRQSGDEFWFLFPGMNQKQALLKAQSILHLLNSSIQINNHQLVLSGSVGITCYPHDGKTVEALEVSAESAMYEAKQAGRNTFRFFARSMQADATRLLKVGQALKLALKRREFHLVYQPKLSLAEGRCFGAEALLRWTNPDLGVIAPDEFIPSAEQQGEINAIGEWVARTAMTQLKAWRDAGLADLTISINLSAIQFAMADLPETMTRMAREIGVPTSFIEFELTEATAVANPEAALQSMKELRSAGFLLAIDDFGTGYASMSYLKQFDVQTLKIDQSLISGVETDARDRSIVETIIQLAHGLDMTALAEGVEDDLELKVIEELGCDKVQGYVYSHPLEPAAFETFCRQKAHYASKNLPKK